jgi:phage head-tail adaptor, putative, SPP1 family
MIEDYYTESVTIKRVTRTNNTSSGLGGYSETWNTHLTIKGSLNPLTGSQVYQAEKRGIKSTHMLICAFADITEFDKAVDTNNNEYEITFVNNPMKMNDHLEINLLLNQ